MDDDVVKDIVDRRRIDAPPHRAVTRPSALAGAIARVVTHTMFSRALDRPCAPVRVPRVGESRRHNRTRTTLVFHHARHGARRRAAERAVVRDMPRRL
jgi:hypothetical protein